MTTPIHDQWKNSRLLSWSLTVAGVLVTGLLSGHKHPLIQGGAFTVGLVASHLALHQKRLAARSENILLNYEQWADEQVLKALCQKQPIVKDDPIVPTWDPTYYNWQEAASEAVGFIIAGNSGAGKTSIACWLTGLVTQSEPSQVLALDPHYNDIWQEQGIQSIGKIPQIEATLQSLLQELDARCDRKGEGKPIGEPMVIIADEIGACLERFSKPKWIISALKRLGSEGRKFKMTLIAINQSQNVEDMGISGALRSNYFIVLAGASARKQARLMGKEYTDSFKGIAYPCMVSGAVEDCLAIHPTHGQYQIFHKHGNPPKNLLPIRQLPLSFLDSIPEFVSGSANNNSAVQPGSKSVQPGSGSEPVQVQNRPEPPRNRPGSDAVQFLNRCLEARFSGSEPDDGSRFTVHGLTASEARERIENLRGSGLNQAQIIWELWGVRKGGSEAYKVALSEYKRITEGLS